MTTDSDQRAGVHPACTAWLAGHPEWAPIPGARSYEASHRGNGVRSLDRIVNGRQLTGKVLSASGRYPKTKITRDDGTTPTVYVHAAVLLAHDGPVPDGMETLHGKGGPLDSRYCGCPAEECTEGNLRYGTHEVNVGETIAAGNARRPATHPCVNHQRCGGMVVNAGSRCLPCVTEVGVRAGTMLRAGMGLAEVARRCGYSNEEWVHTLAARHGGWPGTRAEARAQRPSWSRKVIVTVCGWLRIGDAR